MTSVVHPVPDRHPGGSQAGGPAWNTRRLADPVSGPAHRSAAGPVTVFAKTRAAAGWIIQHAPSDIARARAAMLAGREPEQHPATAARPIGEGRPPVNYDEFITAVCDRGHYDSHGHARNITRAVLEILATRVPAGLAAGLAAQLPSPLAEALHPAGQSPAGPGGVEEFLLRVAESTAPGLRSAEWDARAVLSTLAEAIPRIQLEQLLTALPPGYAPLFGRTRPGQPAAAGHRVGSEA